MVNLLSDSLKETRHLNEILGPDISSKKSPARSKIFWPEPGRAGPEQHWIRPLERRINPPRALLEATSPPGIPMIDS